MFVTPNIYVVCFIIFLWNCSFYILKVFFFDLLVTEIFFRLVFAAWFQSCIHGSVEVRRWNDFSLIVLFTTFSVQTPCVRWNVRLLNNLICPFSEFVVPRAVHICSSLLASVSVNSWISKVCERDISKKYWSSFSISVGYPSPLFTGTLSR